MEEVQGDLAGVAATVFTVAIIWAGFNLVIQNARWTQIGNVVIGGSLRQAVWLIG